MDKIKLSDQAEKLLIDNEVFTNIEDLKHIVRSSTLVIAANDSSILNKTQADYVCTGTNDHLVFTTAINALPSSGGKIQLTDGTFRFGTTLTIAKDNVAIVGAGFNTYIRYNGIAFALNLGTTKHCLIENVRFDFGGIDATSATKWVFTNIWRDNPAVAGTDPFLIDHWSEEHLAPRSCDSFTYQSFKHPLVKVLDSFETDDWTAPNGTLTFDTDIKFSGTRSAKIITPEGSPGRLDKIVSNVDLTDCAMGILVYTPDASKIAEYRFYARTTNTTWQIYAYDVFTNIYTVNNHWHLIVFPRFSQFANTPDLSNVNLFRLQVTPVTGQVATVYIDKFICWKKNVLAPKGIVTFTFDDGMPSVVTKAKPLFDKYNYAGVFSQIINKMDATQIANARLMQSDGWDIVSHSYDHDYTKSTYDPAWQYILAQKWLADNGFKTGSGYALLNNGVTNDKMMRLLNDNLIFARSSTVGYNALPCIGTTAASQVVRQNVTTATIRGWIDIAKANCVWLNIMMHDVKDTTTSDYDVSVATLTDMIDYCNSQGVEVLTFSQIAERIRNTAIFNNGSGTIASGTTSITIRHGFAQIPKNLQVTATSSLGSAASIWISAKTAQTFTVSCNVNPGQNITFDWIAEL